MPVLAEPLARLIAVPALGAAALLLLPRRLSLRTVRRLALGVALVAAADALLLARRLDPTAAGDSVAVNLAWIEAWGARCALGLDGLSYLFVGLTAVLGLVAVLASWESREMPHEFFAALLLLQASLQAVFLARDLLLFFVAWEAMLVPMYLFIAVWGGPRRAYASIKFVLFTLVGSLPMLLSILAVHLWHGRIEGEPTFALDRLAAIDYAAAFPDAVLLGLSAPTWCFLGLLVAFAVKIPVWPLHTWLPDAHTEAPTAGSILLAAVMLKMGLYGLLRVAFPLFPAAAAAAAPWMIGLGLVAIVWGAWAAAVQDDLKRLVAFSSVAHMGTAVVALFAAAGGGPARPALDGAAMVALNHGISTGALFLCVGYLYDRTHSRALADYGGLARAMPRFATMFGIVVFSSAALPGTNGFIGEVLSIAGAFRYRHVVGAAVATTAVWGAAYLLWAYRRVVWGPVPSAPHLGTGARPDAGRRGLDRDLDARETAALALLVVAILWIGVHPAPVLRFIDAPLGRIAAALAR